MDLLTYHMVMMELINVFGFMITFCGVHADVKEMMMLGIVILPIKFIGQLMFHTLTCIERYLAAVHPIRYVSLKNGNRARNVIITCVWLLSFSVSFFMNVSQGIFITVIVFCLVPTMMISMSFCSISILCTLINQTPGDRNKGRNTKRINPMKLRAFCTVMIILGVLLFRFGGNIFANTMDRIMKLGKSEKCGMLLSDLIISLPCSLVLPLLFLNKIGKLKCH